MGIIGNEIADQLANEGTLLDKPTNIPWIHITHTTPHWLKGVPTGTHTGAIYNLQAYINKEHMDQKLRLAQSKSTYIDKWTSIDHINHKLFNQFWENLGITNAHVTQTLKFWYAQYGQSSQEYILPQPELYTMPQ